MYLNKAHCASNSSRRRIPLSRDPYHQRFLCEARNPRDLETTDEWFRRNPSARCRIVGSSRSGGGLWNVTFYPRKGLGCELLAEELRIILAARFPNGTPLARLEQVFDWLKGGGCFHKAA
ncbi:MAG: hypothetical protein WBB98_03920 [Xanthobacteraceae bacterium]